jgi:hypothetical protein
VCCPFGTAALAVRHRDAYRSPGPDGQRGSEEATANTLLLVRFAHVTASQDAGSAFAERTFVRYAPKLRTFSEG